MEKDTCKKNQCSEPCAINSDLCAKHRVLEILRKERLRKKRLDKKRFIPNNKGSESTYFKSGKDNINNKLTDEQVKEIFASSYSNAYLAEQYGISRNYAYLIRKGLRRSDITKNSQAS